SLLELLIRHIHNRIPSPFDSFQFEVTGSAADISYLCGLVSPRSALATGRRLTRTGKRRRPHGPARARAGPPPSGARGSAQTLECHMEGERGGRPLGSRGLLTWVASVWALDHSGPRMTAG